MIDSNTQVRQKKEGKKKEKKMFRVRTTLISKQGALTCVPFPIKRKLEIRMTRPCIDLACLFFFSKLQRLTFFFPLYEKLWYINSSTRLEIEKVILFAKGFIFFFFFARRLTAPAEGKFKTVSKVPGPFSLPIFGTRWIFSCIGYYKLNKIHDAYKGKKFITIGFSFTLIIPMNEIWNLLRGMNIRRIF